LQWSAQKNVAQPVLFVATLDTGIRTRIADRFIFPGYTLGSPFDHLGSAVTWSPGSPDLYFVSAAESGAPEIRHFRPGSSADSDLIVDNFGAKDVVLDLALSKDGRRLGYDRWADQKVEVHVRDLLSHKDRVIWTEPNAWRFAVQIKGWRADDAALIAVRSTRNQEGSLRAELFQIGIDGRTTPEELISAHARSLGAIFSAADGLLYVTTVDGPVHNVSSFSIADGRLRKLTTNTVPGVTFAGLHVTLDGRLLFSRQEIKQDIWAIRFRH